MMSALILFATLLYPALSASADVVSSFEREKESRAIM